MKSLLLVLCICSIQNLLAQFVVKGTVAEENQRSLSGVNITLHRLGQTQILSFAIADAKGEFVLKYNLPTGDTLELTASLIGYKTQTLAFTSGSKTQFNFTLSSQAYVLPEVKIKSVPVWQRKDTINYSVSEFKQPQDRVIGDIIGRLPGIEVAPGGQIKYNGKPINKYYIEGLDLLEDRYGIVNNNLPAESVDKVQVLENHQPIRVLDSVSFSDRAALNIKLKNNAKMRIIGRAKLGMGLSPFLSEDEISPMLFKKDLQFIDTYKYNNTGVDNTKELETKNISEYINAIQNGAIKNDLISVVQPEPPPISSQRYLFNHSHTASVNQLLPLSSEYQFRINASFVNDLQTQQSSTQTKFYLPTDTVSLNEKNEWRNNLNLLQTDLSLLANTPTYYLKNMLRFQGWWSDVRSIISTNNIIDQQLNNPFYNFSNDFKLLKRKRNSIYEYGSYAGIVSLPQHLTISPGLYSDLLNSNTAYIYLLQNASLKTFYTDNYCSLTYTKSKINIQQKIGFNIQSQNLITDLRIQSTGVEHLAADSFQNHLKWDRYRVYAENKLEYANGKWRYTFSLPLNFSKISYLDTPLKLNNEKQRLLISPAFTAMFQIASKFVLSGSAFYNQNFGDILSVAEGYILKNYRNFSNNNALLAEVTSENISASVSYKNPLKVIFFNTGIVFSRSKSNLLYSQEFAGSLQTISAIEKDNYSNTTNVYGRFSKYIMNWKTSVVLNCSYSFGNREQLQQQKLVPLTNKSLSAAATITTKISSVISGDYSYSYLAYASESQLTKSETSVRSANQKISMNYFPSTNFLFRVSAEYYFGMNTFSSAKNYFFTDFNMRYKPKRSRMDLELTCQNLLDTKTFTTAVIMNNIETVSELQIRPRQVLAKVNFSF